MSSENNETDGIVTEDSGTTETASIQTEAENIDFAKMGDEELNALFDAYKDEEDFPSEQQLEPEGKRGVETPKTEQVKEEEPTAPVSRAEFNELLKRLQSQEKQVQGQEILLQRRTSELGEVKKRLASVQQDLEARYKAALENQDPEQALDLRDDLKKVKQGMEQVDAEAEKLQRRAETVGLIQNHVGEEDFNIDEMAETLAGDGVAMEYVEQFKKDPIGFVDGDYNPGLVLVQMAKRARAESTLKKLYSVAQRRVDENKRLKESSSGVMRKIQNVAKRTPEISAGGGRPSKQNLATSIDPSRIHELSDADLEEILANQ
jgi:hypothetical protein